jgi:hypothetical protein
MHATRDTSDVMKRNLAGGRVMPGVGRLGEYRGASHFLNTRREIDGWKSKKI